MIQTEIPRVQWAEFCGLFSGQHRGWLLTVGRTDAPATDWPTGLSTRVLAHDLPFREIAVRESGQSCELTILAGPQPEHFAYLVREPRQFSFEQEDDGTHAGLSIEQDDGRVIELRFRAAAHPESLNGIAPAEW
jgi:hypothetical protein